MEKGRLAIPKPMKGGRKKSHLEGNCYFGVKKKKKESHGVTKLKKGSDWVSKDEWD